MKPADTVSFFITNGLSFERAALRYNQRRRDLLASLSELTVLSGMTLPLSQNNIWLMPDVALYQDPVMLYLTGLNQAEVGLVLDPFQNKITLCLPRKDATKVFWEGDFLGVSELDNNDICTLFQVDEVVAYDEMGAYVSQSLDSASSSTITLYWHEEPDKNIEPLQDSYDVFKQIMMETFEDEAITWKNCFDLLQTRLILDSVDSLNLKKANQLTSIIFKHVCTALNECSSETEVAGIIKGDCIKHSWMGQSFPAIVASGKNATILHYKHHNDVLDKQGLLLLDFGCCYEVMPADISRTIPVNGTFNPLQRMLYSIVLEAQELVESTIKPGVTIDELNDLCWEYIETQLDQQFFSKGGSLQRPYLKQPHNVSHLIAHMVHDGDPYRAYRTAPLKPGWVISVEPGVYGHFCLEIAGVVYDEYIGIRIEDNILITETGSENLSKDCPKSVADIEALLA
jgi:Xaa-Pro aminopeptidase